MKKLFDKGVTHIITSNNGYYFVTAGVYSEIYHASKDNNIGSVETYSKANYVYPYGKENVFITSAYYRACAYENGRMKKYRTKLDSGVGSHGVVFDKDNIYYYTDSMSADTKLWKLNVESGVNEEIRLEIPKKKKRRIRYSYISMHEDRLIIIYYYFGEEEDVFEDMYIREYKCTHDKYELLREKWIEKGVRGLYGNESEESKENVLLFEKAEFVSGRLRIQEEYLGIIDDKLEIKKIFQVPNVGVKSYAVSFEKRIVVLAYAKKILVYHMDTREMVRDLSNMLGDVSEGRLFHDLGVSDGKLRVVCSDGVHESENMETEELLNLLEGLLGEREKKHFCSVCFIAGKLLVASTNGVWELTEEEYL